MAVTAVATAQAMVSVAKRRYAKSAITAAIATPSAINAISCVTTIMATAYSRQNSRAAYARVSLRVTSTKRSTTSAIVYRRLRKINTALTAKTKSISTLHHRRRKRRLTTMIVNPHRTPGKCFRHPRDSWVMAGRSVVAMVAVAVVGGTAAIVAMAPVVAMVTMATMATMATRAWPAPTVVTTAMVVTNAAAVKNSGPRKQGKASRNRNLRRNAMGRAKGSLGINSANSSGATQPPAALAGKTNSGSAVPGSAGSAPGCYALFFSPPSASTKSASIAASSPVISAKSISNCSSASSA